MKGINSNRPFVLVHKDRLTQSGAPGYEAFKASYEKRGIDVVELSDADLNRISKFFEEFPEIANFPGVLISAISAIQKKHSSRGK